MNECMMVAGVLMKQLGGILAQGSQRSCHRNDKLRKIKVTQKKKKKIYINSEKEDDDER